MLKVDTKYCIVYFDQSTHDLSGDLESNLKSLLAIMSIMSIISIINPFFCYVYLDLYVPIDCVSYNIGSKHMSKTK